MWLIEVTCSDPRCDEIFELEVDDLAEVEQTVCACEHGVVVISVSQLEPLHLAAA
jgi:hypothetical protein